MRLQQPFRVVATPRPGHPGAKRGISYHDGFLSCNFFPFSLGSRLTENLHSFIATRTHIQKYFAGLAAIHDETIVAISICQNVAHDCTGRQRPGVLQLGQNR